MQGHCNGPDWTVLALDLTAIARTDAFVAVCLRAISRPPRTCYFLGARIHGPADVGAEAWPCGAGVAREAETGTRVL